MYGICSISTRFIYCIQIHISAASHTNILPSRSIISTIPGRPFYFHSTKETAYSKACRRRRRDMYKNSHQPPSHRHFGCYYFRLLYSRDKLSIIRQLSVAFMALLVRIMNRRYERTHATGEGMKSTWIDQETGVG